MAALCCRPWWRGWQRRNSARKAPRGADFPAFSSYFGNSNSNSDPDARRLPLISVHAELRAGAPHVAEDEAR
eukprot:3954689-Pleurochrysis_carterae.AAC.1